MQNNGSFVVISDFHSTDWPLKKVKDYYMNEYDVVYVLGDVTDRGPYMDGTNGISMLLEMMELSKSNVVYIPGNHDDFIYKYMNLRLRGIQGESLDLISYNVIRNGGKKTIDDLEFLYNNNRSLYIKLYNWLGSLPIQVKHKFDNVEYNLAHAFFNEKLYKINPNFNLETLNTGQEANLNPSQILWFRKNNDSYDSKVLPNAKSKIIIGHTPLRFREGVDLDLVNQYNEKVPVICVDGGIAYDNKMVKFVAGHSRSIGSVIESYNYVPPKKADSIPERTTSKVQKLGVIKKSILKRLKLRKRLSINRVFGRQNKYYNT